MEKLDLKKTNKECYAPSHKQPSIVDVPTYNFIMLDGHGNPNTHPDYAEVVSALYQFAYALKFHIKKTQGSDYAVMPLEGLWWIAEGLSFSSDNKDDWEWTMMIVQPAMVTDEHIHEIRKQLAVKKPSSWLEKLRYEPYTEGLSVQIMHIGPYNTEATNIQLMHKFAQTHGYALRGKHHEIYLSDPRRTQPEKLKTIIRQPIEK